MDIKSSPMKKSFQLLLILFISASAAGQTPGEANEALIKDLIVDSFQGIFSDLDPEALKEHCTEDFLLLETGEVWDMERMREYVARAREQKNRSERINSFEFIEIKIEGKMAWTAYHNTAHFKRNGEVVGEMNWLESATAILTEDGWKLQMLHSTVVEDE